jgi:hypothetical protein
MGCDGRFDSAAGTWAKDHSSDAASTAAQRPEYSWKINL